MNLLDILLGFLLIGLVILIGITFIGFCALMGLVIGRVFYEKICEILKIPVSENGDDGETE